MEAVRTSETSVYSNNTSQKTLNFILAAARTGNLTLLVNIYIYVQIFLNSDRFKKVFYLLNSEILRFTALTLAYTFAFAPFLAIQNIVYL
jgi:hypothetical protein